MELTSSVSKAPDTPTKNPKLWAAAQQLEATFLSEMLKIGGLGGTNDSFGGGVGEQQFSGLLVDAQARDLVQGGGIGLAESIYTSLVKRAEE